MHKIILGTAALVGLIIGSSVIAVAAPASPMLGRNTIVQASSVEHVAYYWNHRRYQHRSWNRRARRWRYY